LRREFEISNFKFEISNFEEVEGLKIADFEMQKF